MSRPKKARWLTRDLLLRLMLPLLAIVVATGALGTYSAHRLTDRVFDRWLLDAARSVASRVRIEQGQASLELPAAAEAILLYDDIDHSDFSVTQEGRLLSGRRGIPDHGESEITYPTGRAFEAIFDGRLMRIAHTQVGANGAPAVTVLVAETLVKRQRSAQELSLILWPMSALLLTAAGAIVLAVRRTVRPLEAIAARWNEQSHVSLQPIGDEGVPRELLPFAAALNELLARIRAMLARERQFAATAAHQLRTPLAGLQLGLARAAAAPDLATAQSVIAELSRATLRTARLVQQLLTLGRIDPEVRADIGLRSGDLIDLTRDVGAALADQAIAKDIDLELIAGSAPVRVGMQPELLAEALSNLIDNAIRYTPNGGRVLIEVVSMPASVRISDTGPGIPADERTAVFERFVRGRLAQGDGSGLGLAIARDIAALHGATVTLDQNDWGGVCVAIIFATVSQQGRQGFSTVADRLTS